MYLSNLSWKKMLVGGDLDLNSTQGYADSFMEATKQTMLKQDLLFRMQVHELHRLYRVQNFLMKDLAVRELNGGNSLNAKAELSVLPHANLSKYESSSNETRLSLSNKVASTPFTSQELLGSHQSTNYRFQKRPLDLQLSFDEFISNVEEDPPKNENFLNQLKGPLDNVHCLSWGNSLDEEEMKLSLSIREENKRKEGRMRTWIVKATQPCCPNVIDLEESVEWESGGYAKYTCTVNCASPNRYSKGDHTPQASFLNPVISLNEKNDPFTETAGSSSAKENSECYQEQAFPTGGIDNCVNLVIATENKECRIGLLHNNLSTKMQQFASYQGGLLDLNKPQLLLDLNKPQLDDLSYHSNVPILEYSTIMGSVANIEEVTCQTPLTEKELNCSNKTSKVYQHKSTVNLASVDLDGKHMGTDIWTGNSNHVTKGSSAVGPESTGISEGPGSCWLDSNIDNSETSKSRLVINSLNDSDCMPTANGEISSEKSAVEDIAVSCATHHKNEVQEEHGDKSPISCKSCCISDNDSSSAKSKQSSLQSNAVTHHSDIFLGSKFPDPLSGQHDLRTADHNDEITENYDQMGVMRRAAESLIHLSSKYPSCYKDSCMQAGLQEMENENSEQPQLSSDSFERIVLKLTEGDANDDSVSSMPFEVTDMDAKDFSLKLRRGRRLKDFQREILPSLASLALHEILEDINIMEGALRSREYRKTRAKMAAQGQNWSTVKRSRRSRLSHVRRRIFA